jgi:predicted TIM-barrel fold metal-dependent hydrolase
MKKTEIEKIIKEKVYRTPFIDTHEHLCEEKSRLKNHDDCWFDILKPYLGDDLISAGLSKDDFEKVWNNETPLSEKWDMVSPYWDFIKNTGYAKSVLITLKELYDVDEITINNLELIQEKFLKLKKKGFYKTVLRNIANVKWCQVNSLEGKLFCETEYPDLLKQDISFVPMFADETSVLGESVEKFSQPTGIDVKNINDWYAVVDWYFNKYGKAAIAVKSQNAYNREMDYERVSKEKAAPIFLKRLNKENMSSDEKKMLEDHLFWYAVDKATEHNLPIKLHTGYFAGANGMPMDRLKNIPAELTAMCMNAPKSKFVFMHMTYPYQNELTAIVKHHTNAHASMCWAWIINPIAAKNFLKEFLVTAPASKILTFGGDYGHVEAVVGHAEIARRGITLALTELVDENWMSLDEVMELIEPIMYKNAERLF